MTVDGYGFVSSTALTCRFTDDRGMHLLSNATFVSTSRITCPLPAAGRASYLDTGVLSVSVDNFVFSNTVPFTVIGAPVDVLVTSPAYGVLYKSTEIVEVDAIRVDAVDDNQHSVLYFDTVESREVVYSVINYTATRDGTTVVDPLQIMLLLTLTNYTIEGRCFVRGIAVRRPRIGVGMLLFRHAAADWNATFAFAIGEGEPYALSLYRNPSLVIDNSNPKLSQQPIVVVVDISGNILQNLENKNSVVTTVSARYFDGNRMTNTSVLAAPLGTFEFTDIRMQGYFGATYSIVFSAALVQAVESPLMSVGLCGATQYGVVGSVQCLACPPHAVCNGSYIFDVEDGYWRSSTRSYALSSCGEPFGEATACKAGFCTEGYTGARCSVCAEGYGKVRLLHVASAFPQRSTQ